MILSKEAEVQWQRRNIKHYKEKGYVYTAIGDYFNVRIEDLSQGSHVAIQVSCDSCGEKSNRPYKQVLAQRGKNEYDDLDYCTKCAKSKSKKTNLKNYGVENPMHVNEFKEKQRNNIEEKYGVPYPLQNKDVLAKMVETNREKYGYDYVTQVPEIKERFHSTNVERYGGTTPFSSLDVRNKAKETLVKNYGVDNPTKNPIIRGRALTSLKENNSISTSSQQTHIHNIIGGELNHLEGNAFLDIAYPNEKVYVEYDGGGHNLGVKLGNISAEEFEQREKRRYFHLLDKGWNCIRIICPSDKLPTDNEIIEFVNNCFSEFENDPLLSSIRWYVDENNIKKNYRRVDRKEVS